MMPKVSVIVATYNWPQALQSVLTGLTKQTLSEFEVIVADDGSSKETTEVVKSYEKKLQLKHVWQKDNGFQLARIRNKAAVQASGKLLIFLDGDCIPRPTFVENHTKLATQGYFTAGGRVLLSKDYTNIVLTGGLPIESYSFSQLYTLKLRKKINRSLPLLTLPLGPLRRLKPKNWKQLRGCNFAVFKKDYISVNGCDEAFTGWGFEDSDLAIRLIRSGVKCLSGRYATTVLHLWHNEQSKDHVIQNQTFLDKIKSSDKISAEKGINQWI